MQDQDKIKEKLIEELAEIRLKLAQSETCLKELSQPESKYRQIIGSLSEAAYVIQGDSIKFANQAVLELTGYSLKEGMAANAIQAFVHPDDQKMVSQYYALRLQGDITPHMYEFRVFCKDGSLKWVELKSTLIMWEGKPAGLGVATDITARKRAEEAHGKSEQTLKTILSTSPVGIVMFKGRQSVWLNDFCVNMFGHDHASELIGQDSRMIYTSEEEYNRVGRELHPNLRAGEIAETKTKLVRKDGSVFDARIRIKLVDPSSAEDLAIAIIVDITDEIRAQQEKENLQAQLFQSQKMESLGTLVGGIAHDFNNMLQGIIGYSEFVLDDRVEGELGYKELQTIIEISEGGAELVKKLLAFGQEAPRLPVALDLNHHVTALSPLIYRTLPHKIELDLDLTHGPVPIHADPKQIDQVIMNLAINASEAMVDGGHVKIATNTTSLDEEYCMTHVGVDPGHYIMLSVTDTGRGMDEDTMAKIFDPFFSTKQRGSTRGTGLGLSVVQGIVTKQGGHITCHSEPGKGTEFKVYFPAIQALSEKPQTVTASIQPEGLITILVVEDNLFVTELERVALERAGYKVCVAINGREAVDIFKTRKESISLVILDLLMPEMSGRDCLMELVKIDPSVKVLIASGYSPEDELETEIRPLVKGFLHKPFKNAELLDVVISALRDS